MLHWYLTGQVSSAVPVQQAQMGVLIPVAAVVHKVDKGAFHISVQAPECSKLKTVWLFGGKAQLVRCLLRYKGCLLVWDAGIWSLCTKHC